MTRSCAAHAIAPLIPYFAAVAAPVARPPSVTGLAPWQARNVARTMLAQLAARISTSTLARECGLSRGHFSRAFKHTFGLPPHSWRQLQRIDLAKSMLVEHRHALVEIAAACGFSDQAHFSRAFKACTGSTPMAWRREAALMPASPRRRVTVLPVAGEHGEPLPARS